MNPYSLTRVLAEPMAIAESHWQSIAERSQSFFAKFEDEKAFPWSDPEEIAEDLADMNSRDYRVSDDGTATLYLTGIIGKRIDQWTARWMGMTDLDKLSDYLQECEDDPMVTAVRLRIDSPGGVVTGVEEVMRQIEAMSKPVIAVSDTIIASAAYFIASACERIECTRSTSLGSIGVVFGRYDLSEHFSKDRKTKPIVVRSGPLKAPGHLPGEKINNQQIADYQARVDAIYTSFMGLLDDYRPQIPDEMRESGRIVRGDDAWEMGLVDDLILKIEE